MFCNIHVTPRISVAAADLSVRGGQREGWECTAYLCGCVLSASLSVIYAKQGNCLKWARPRWQILWFSFSSCSCSGSQRLYHMQPPPTLHHLCCSTPSTKAHLPPPLSFNSPTLSSPLHPIFFFRQQCSSCRTALLSTGFCGIYSNILTFRLPSLPEQKWFVTAGDGLGRRSFLWHPAFVSPPLVLLCRKADFLFWLASFYPSSFIHRCSSCQLVKTLKAPLISFRLTPQCDRQTGWYSSICWHLVFAVFFFLWLLLSAHLLFDPALTPCLAPQRVILLRLLSESFRGCGATKSLRARLFNQRFIDQLTSEI